MEALLRPTEELLCVAPAAHQCSDGRGRRVWLGVGRTRTRGDHAVFIFARTRFPFLASLREWVYCVLPIVANIHISIEPEPGICAFSWSRQELHQGTSKYGDFVITDVRDTYILKVLEDHYQHAYDAGLTFHEEQRGNHREIWAYREAIPLDVARLPLDQIVIPPRGTSSTSSAARMRCITAPRLSVNGGQTSLKLMCVTWNVGATEPTKEHGLEPLLLEEPKADILCIGLQEVCALNSPDWLIRDGQEWQAWREWIEAGVEETYEGDMTLLKMSRLVGMFILVFIRRDLRRQVSNVRSRVVPTALGGYGGNKGAACIRFEIGRTSLCMINVHLAAGQQHYIERCQHFRTIIERIQFSLADEPSNEDNEDDAVPDTPPQRQSSKPLSFKLSDRARAPAQGDGQEKAVATIHDHDHIVWLGDTNSRLHWPGKLGGMPISLAIEKVKEKSFGELLSLDQLNMMRRDGMAFDGFKEHRIFFLPSYKWKPGGDALDMRNQKHVLAWTDRILFRSMRRPEAEAYRYDMFRGLKQSDHRPVFACLAVPWEPRLEDHFMSRSTDVARVLGDRCSLRASGHMGPPLLLPPAQVAQQRRFLAHRHSSATRQAGSYRPGQSFSSDEFDMFLEPRELTFYGLKPGQPKQALIRLGLNSPIARQGVVAHQPFTFFSVSPTGSLQPLNQRGVPRRGSVAVLMHALQVDPAEGVLSDLTHTEVRVDIHFRSGALRSRQCSMDLVVRVGLGSNEVDFRITVRATIEPTVLGASLADLAALGNRQILDEDHGKRVILGLARQSLCVVATRSSAAVDPSQPLPPKEVMSVMRWLLMVSQLSAPGTMEWWPDAPLSDASSCDSEVLEIQRCVEWGLPLPFPFRVTQKLPVRAAVFFLVRWLGALPEPVLPPAALDTDEDEDLDIDTVLRGVHPLPRSVLLCIAGLITQVAMVHGERPGAVQCFAGAFTQQTPASARANRWLNLVIADLRSDSWPPLATMRALPRYHEVHSVHR